MNTFLLIIVLNTPIGETQQRVTFETIEGCNAARAAALSANSLFKTDVRECEVLETNILPKSDKKVTQNES